MRNRIIVAVLIILVIASIWFAWNYGGGYSNGYGSGYKQGAKEATNLQNNVSFTAQELQTFQTVRDRIYVYNTDPNFTGTRLLEWISMRNSTSASWDPPQKSMEYLCFWSGRGAAGEWQAVVSIYNAPNSTTDYVIEVSRFTWHSLEIRLDGKIMASFPQVNRDTTSLGYVTFLVKI